MGFKPKILQRSKYSGLLVNKNNFWLRYLLIFYVLLIFPTSEGANYDYFSQHR